MSESEDTVRKLKKWKDIDEKRERGESPQIDIENTDDYAMPSMNSLNEYIDKLKALYGIGLILSILSFIGALVTTVCFWNGPLRITGAVGMLISMIMMGVCYWLSD
jgi:hypothetical protein